MWRLKFRAFDHLLLQFRLPPAAGGRTWPLQGQIRPPRASAELSSSFLPTCAKERDLEQQELMLKLQLEELKMKNLVRFGSTEPNPVRSGPLDPTQTRPGPVRPTRPKPKPKPKSRSQPGPPLGPGPSPKPRPKPGSAHIYSSAQSTIHSEGQSPAGLGLHLQRASTSSSTSRRSPLPPQLLPPTEGLQPLDLGQPMRSDGQGWRTRPIKKHEQPERRGGRLVY